MFQFEEEEERKKKIIIIYIGWGGKKEEVEKETSNNMLLKNKEKIKKEMMKDEHLFSYDKNTTYEKVTRVKVLYRALIRYPQLNQMPCKIKGCIHKKRNGRCGLEKCQLELDDNDNLTGTCLCFKKEEKV